MERNIRKEINRYIDEMYAELIKVQTEALRWLKTVLAVCECMSFAKL